MFVESGGFTAKTSSCGQHKEGKNTILNLAHSFTILFLLGLFLVTVLRLLEDSWNDRRMCSDENSLRQRMHPVIDSRSLWL